MKPRLPYRPHWPAFPVTRGSDLGAEVWLGPSQLGHDAIDVSQLPASRTPWDPAEHAAPRTRFVTPEQFLDCLPVTVRMSMAKSAVVDALAADADGVLLNFEMPEFYRVHVANVFNRDVAVDEEETTLVYDAFTASLCPDLRAPSPGTREALAVRVLPRTTNLRLEHRCVTPGAAPEAVGRAVFRADSEHPRTAEGAGTLQLGVPERAQLHVRRDGLHDVARR